VASKADYYEVLGLGREASAEEVKRAYRQAALKFHPDRNKAPEAEQRFKDASEAYEVLSDAEKRARYDRYGHAGMNGAGLHDFSHMQAEDIFSVFSDLFGEAFGGRRAQSDRGVDIQAVVEVDLREVAAGGRKTLRFERMDLCEHCTGQGSEPGTQPERCRTCGGYGQVERQSGAGFFVSRVITDCPTCRGRGQIIRTPCGACRGSGRSPRQRAVDIDIPAGIHDGQSLRIRGEGEPGAKGTVRGDLRCVIRVRPHPLFVRQDRHLVCALPISFTQASLGAEIDVPTLDGTTRLRLKAGTQSGDLYKLAGKGLPDLHNGRRGDEVIQVQVEIPKKLTKKQEELLRQFAETEDVSVLPQSSGFFDKVKEYLAGLTAETKSRKDQE
jgi:molecular chaperone DnaJ